MPSEIGVQKAIAVVIASLTMRDPFAYQVEEFAKIWPRYGVRVKQLRELSESGVLHYRRKAGAKSYWTLGPQAQSVLSNQSLALV